MSKPAVRAVAVLLLVLALANLATWPSPQSLWVFWMKSHDYGHAPLIALLAAGWMARIAWHEGLGDARFSPVGTALLATSLIAWLITLRANLDIAHQLLWPFVVAAALFAMLGSAVVRRFAAPLVFIYFAIPVWDYTVPALVRLSIFFSEHMLALLQVPATISENLVTIPAGRFAIVDDCSGKHFLLVTLAIGWLATATNHISGWRRAVFMLICAGLSMFTNWVRIVTIIYAGHASDMQHYLVAEEHLSFGYALFIPLLAGVLLLARKLGVRWAVGPVPVVAQPGLEMTAAGNPAWTLVPAGFLLASFGLGFTGGSAASVAMRALPVATGAWQGPLPPRSNWMPLYASADAQVRVSYTNPADEVIELYANLYSKQLNGQELIHYGNSLIKPTGWSKDWSAVMTRIPGGSQPLSAVQMRDSFGQLWVLAHVYRVGSASYRSEALAKLAYGWRSLSGPPPSGIIAVAARCDARNCDRANMLVADFWEYMEPELLALVPAGVSASE